MKRFRIFVPNNIHGCSPKGFVNTALLLLLLLLFQQRVLPKSFVDSLSSSTVAAAAAATTPARRRRGSQSTAPATSRSCVIGRGGYQWYATSSSSRSSCHDHRSIDHCLRLDWCDCTAQRVSTGGARTAPSCTGLDLIHFCCPTGSLPCSKYSS